MLARPDNTRAYQTIFSYLTDALGMIIGLLTGGLSGIFAGFLIAGAIAVGFFCLANVFKANGASDVRDTFNEIPTHSQLDRSQLPKAAYEPHGNADAI